MRRLLVLTALILGAPALHADSPALTVAQQLLPSPAPVGATDPVFIPTPAGTQLAWSERAPGNKIQYFGASWDHTSFRWSSPAPISIDAATASSTTRVRFPDESQLSAFFPEKDGRILDLHTQRQRGKILATPKPLSADSWPKTSTSATPAGRPVIRAREARVVTVWLNHAENSPRLFAALSTSAGEQFFLPVRIDDGHPLGHASLALLHDGSAYITWLETHGSEKNATALWLRRLSPSGDLSVPVLITTAPSAAALGHPQLALIKDYDTTPAQLLIAHELTTDGVTQLVTRLITLPPAESFLQGRPCLTCPPDTASLPGHPLTGGVIKLIPRKHQVVINHLEIPGILPAGKTIFHIDDKTLIALNNVTSLFARIEQRDGVWWLFDVNPVTTANRKRPL